MDETYYISHGEQIPVKWTAPEVQRNYRGFSHDIITFKNVNMYEGKQKTATMLEYKEMIASMAILVNAKRRF